MKLLVSAKLRKSQKTVIEKTLDKNVELTYLQDLSKNKRGDEISGADVFLSLIPEKEFQKAELALLHKGQLMQFMFAGVDHVDFNIFPEEMTMASNIGAYAEPMAEHVLAMILALQKRLFEEYHNMKNGQFNQMVMNKSLKKSTVGILGFGGIGKASARLLRGFGSRIMAINTSGYTDDPVDYAGTLDNLDYVLEESDVLIISLPLNKNTFELLGKQELGMMKKDAIIINVARGEIINQKALYEHLKKNPEFKAGIDAWWVEPLRHGRFELNYPFFDLPNVLGSPHNSYAAEGALEEGVQTAIENINRFVKGESVQGVVRREDYAGAEFK